MADIAEEIRLVAEHYDMHPQAVLWVRPIFAPGNTICDFEYIYSNNEGLAYLNMSREQFKGLLLSNGPINNDLQKNIFAELLTIYETGKKTETTIYNQVLNKYAKVLRARLHSGILNVVQDVTSEHRVISQLGAQARQLEEQKRQLEEQKALLDNILSNSSNGISVSRVLRSEQGEVIDAMTIMANDSAVKYTGLPKDIYLGKRATELEPAIMQTPYYRACVHTLTTGEPFVMQYQLESTGRWLELTVSRLDHDHLIQIFGDVTAIKEAQLEVEKAAERLKTVFNSTQTGMFMLTPELDGQGELADFRFSMVNATLSEYVQQPPAALNGDLASKWFPGYLQNGVFDMYRYTYLTGQPQRRDVHYHVDGHDSYLDLQSLRIEGQVLVTFADLTTQRKSQVQLEETVQALERSNTQLEDFAYAASHDLKEPIRKVLNFISRLKTSMGDRMNDAEKNLFERTESAANRMHLLVDDLLEFSHVSEHVRHTGPVDLNDRLQRVLTDLELAIEEKQACIVVTHKLPVVQGSPRHMEQMFQNLLSNALKYSKADAAPRITIAATMLPPTDPQVLQFTSTAAHSFYHIPVTDNGIGFEPQYSGQIFEIFKRLHGKAEYSGTGIGLAIVRKVVENHNGYIWAQGQPDQGATFHILLPAEGGVSGKW